VSSCGDLHGGLLTRLAAGFAADHVDSGARVTT